MLAERARVSALNDRNGDTEDELQMIFARRAAEYEEGIVLKAEESRYNDWNMSWVKVCYCHASSIRPDTHGDGNWLHLAEERLHQGLR